MEQAGFDEKATLQFLNMRHGAQHGFASNAMRNAEAVERMPEVWDGGAK
jgi:hypothetical protein